MGAHDGIACIEYLEGADRGTEQYNGDRLGRLCEQCQCGSEHKGHGAG